MGWQQCTVLVVLMIATVSQARSADENLNLNASVGAFYDSNRYLRQNGGDELSGLVEIARVLYSNESEESSWNGNLSAMNEQIPDAREDENDSFSLGLDGEKLFQRSSLYGSLGFEMDSTLSSDVQAAGVFVDNKDRMQSSASGGYTHSVSEVDQIDFGFSAESVDYDEIRARQFAEYIFYGVNAGYGRSLTEADRLYVSLYGNVLDNQYSGLISETQGFRLNWDHRVTERWQWKAGLGLRESTYETEYRLPWGGIYRFSDSSRSRVTNFELTYDGEVSKSILSGSYDLLPSSNGNLVARQSIEASWHRQWSSTQNSSMKVAYWRQRSDLTTDSVDDLNSVQLNFSYSWRFFRKWNAVFRCSGLDRLLLAGDIEARSQYVGVDIAWMEDPISLR